MHSCTSSVFFKYISHRRQTMTILNASFPLLHEHTTWFLFRAQQSSSQHILRPGHRNPDVAPGKHPKGRAGEQKENSGEQLMCLFLILLPWLVSTHRQVNLPFSWFPIHLLSSWFFFWEVVKAIMTVTRWKAPLEAQHSLLCVAHSLHNITKSDLTSASLALKYNLGCCHYSLTS